MWDIPGLQERLKNDFDLDLPIAEWLDIGQTAAHFAAFAHLLNDNFIQSNTGFLDAAFRAFIIKEHA